MEQRRKGYKMVWSLKSEECAGLPQQSHVNQHAVQGEGVWSEELGGMLVARRKILPTIT